MSALEREIIEKFHQLDAEARQRVRAAIQAESSIVQVDGEPFDFEAWLAEVEVLRAEIQVELPDSDTVGALSLLDELREEASA
jgi:hypothetical protein